MTSLENENNTNENINEQHKQLAQLLFPNVTKSIADYETMFPPRDSGVQVSRIAPSPTGYLHIGTVYMALVAERFVHQGDKNGIFFLRVEDTDQKREVPGAVKQIVNRLEEFHIHIDEGRLLHGDVGSYGPYAQSERKDMYHAFVKWLVEQGKAYPCWMSQEEIDEVRRMQEAAKKIPGIYGQYAQWRDATFEQQKQKIEAGEPFVIRLRSPAVSTDVVTVTDLIKGSTTMQANFLDVVLLKSSDGLPTYHFAHLVDDYLMRTTHVIRGDEWFASLPLHMQLFEVFGFQKPVYAHVSPLLKYDATTGNKRKISKRHDPEANADWFFEQGIPTEAIIEFLMNIIDPFFEERQKNNPDKTYKDYLFELENMNSAGALFDLTKLLFVSKEWIAKLDKEQFYDMALQWVKKYGDPEVAELMESEKEYAFNALNIERLTDTDPKRYRMFSDVAVQLPAFFDSIWQEMSLKSLEVPEMCTSDRMQPFMEKYLQEIDLTISKDERFAQLKHIGKDFGFASSNAEFKEGGYVGKIGDLAMYLRIKLLCSPTTPDLYESMRVMGKERVAKRLQSNP